MFAGYLGKDAVEKNAPCALQPYNALTFLVKGFPF